MCYSKRPVATHLQGSRNGRRTIANIEDLGFHCGIGSFPDAPRRHGWSKLRYSSFAGAVVAASKEHSGVVVLSTEPPGLSSADSEDPVAGPGNSVEAEAADQVARDDPVVETAAVVAMED